MKGFKLFTGRSKSGTVNYLSLTPITLISFEKGPEGHITLLIPRFTSMFWNKHLMKAAKKKFIHLNLDEYGSATWDLIDGKRTVGEICDLLVASYGESIQPVEDRVTKFITGLFQNKFLTFKELPTK